MVVSQIRLFIQVVVGVRKSPSRLRQANVFLDFQPRWYLHDTVITTRHDHGTIPIEMNGIDRIRVCWKCLDGFSWGWVKDERVTTMSAFPLLFLTDDS